MPTFLNFVIFVLALTAVMKKTSSFILNSQTCSAYQPCTCSGNLLDCQDKGLSDIPKFYPSNVIGSSMNLYLYNNQLTTIPADAFRNFTVSNNTVLNIQIQRNHLNSIVTNAFRGIRDAIIILNLQSNNLTSLPSELLSLTHLESLNLFSNPITSLSILHQLRKNLKTLFIDLKQFNGWPVEFNSFTSLKVLHVRYLNTTQIDYNVFDRLANTLSTLDIQYSQLVNVPVAICHLHKLQSLTFANNNNIHVNSTVLEPCSRNLSPVISVTLTGNQLRYMPNVFRSFPSMTSLNLNINKLSYIHWDTIPSNVPLTTLFLEFNDFTRISSTVDKLHALATLIMPYNKITSIDESDLSNLARLRYLHLDGNPIEYISPHAFKNNLALNRINLQNTNLRLLPSSLANLQNLQYLYLSGSPIECSCDMSFLKPLNVTKISIYGACKSSSIQIKSYLTYNLPKCPEAWLL